MDTQISFLVEGLFSARVTRRILGGLSGIISLGHSGIYMNIMQVLKQILRLTGPTEICFHFIKGNFLEEKCLQHPPKIYRFRVYKKTLNPSRNFL